MLALLTGGTGGAKLVDGLSRETTPEELAIVCNTGDDLILHGLYISPDLDTIAYTLADVADSEKGWGVRGETYHALEWLAKYGGDDWFNLGDRDLARHIARTQLLHAGATLTQATERLTRALGVGAKLLPMSDDRVETRIGTADGEISFQEYFVKRRWAVEANRILYKDAEKSRPAPGVIEAIRDANTVILCPSNPATSIGPILAVPGIRQAVRETRKPVIAVSPIIAGAPVTGPTDKLMRAAGAEPTVFGVAKGYADFLDVLAIAPEDRDWRTRIEALGVQTVELPIRMRTLEDRRALARELLALL
ncbi:MAG TPA: 2-phospho-L-lactate transferase [Candidatus Binatia bacterium]|nr:2-phospho-L-lactate transferase [Candidatus Binatia bacterium]